jgi:hypothetical protein
MQLPHLELFIDWASQETMPEPPHRGHLRLIFSTEFLLTEEVMSIQYIHTIMAAEDPIKLIFGAYYIQFDQSEYKSKLGTILR